MPTTHVMRRNALCALAFMLLNTPAEGKPTSTGASDGGLSEVQNRLTGKQTESPEIAEARAKLLTTLTTTNGLGDIDEWKALVILAASRPGYAAELPASEMVAALDEVNSYLSKNSRPEIAHDALEKLADPEKMRVDGDAAAALMQTLAYKSPSKFVHAVLTGQRVQLPTPFKTPDLQRAYDKLLGAAEKPLTILKNDREFLMIQPSGDCELFADDTRFVVQNTKIDSRQVRPQITQDDGYAGEVSAPGFKRQILLDGDGVIERTTITNDSATSKDVDVFDSFNCDFKDMFEIRGWKRPKNGVMLGEHLSPVMMKMSYKGLDGYTMSTTIAAAPIKNANIWFSKEGISFTKTLAPHTSATYEFSMFPSPAQAHVVPYLTARAEADAKYHQWRDNGAVIETDSTDWNRMLERGWKDLYMLRQRTTGGEAIAAGLPWFASPFGRDELIVSLQMLAFKPDLAHDVLKLLAHHQGIRNDQYRAEKPGKIMHELRVGEMARNHEIPFTPYFGTVDATPLWVVLLGRYFQQTDDTDLLRSMDKHLRLALEYLMSESAATGFLSYGGAAKEALSNQGWKDSGDSVFYSNGELAQVPIALSEVQGYLYEALQYGSQLNSLLGHANRMPPLDARAALLKEKFNKDFWMPEKNYVALAIDGLGAQCDVIASNPGQLLSTPLLDPDHAREVSERLMQDDMFSGFGIRTLSTTEKRYFQNSYHNGSVWPHDVSLICAGVQKNAPASAAKLADGLMAAARYQNEFRLPELFGGYSRESQAVPIPYPVACEPQAWAAGTPFLALTACAGIRVDAPHRKVTISHPYLPASISTMTLKNLPTGNKTTVSLRYTKTAAGAEVQVLENPFKIKVVVEK